MSQTNRNSIRKLTLAAVFMALAIVVTRFLSINVAVFRFGFGMVPVHLAGYLLGPFWGALTGLLADLIGLMINAGGTPHLGITFTTAMHGFLAGMVVYWNKSRLNPLTVTVSGVLTSILCSLLLMSFWLSQLFGDGFTIVLQARAVNVFGQGLALIIVETLLIPVLYSIRRYLPKGTEISWRLNRTEDKYGKISEPSDK